MQAADSAAFQEFGLVRSEAAEYRNAKGRGAVHAYQMKDATGGLAAWDWLRKSDARRCSLSEQCAAWDNTILVNDANYVLEFRGLSTSKADLAALIKALPDRHPSDLPPVLNFVPLKDLFPNSARYLRGPAILGAVAP